MSQVSSPDRVDSLVRHRDGDYWTNLVLVLVVWFAVAWAFGRQQELWVDETTQLSGLTLDPLEMTSWLSGINIGRFDVPGDRMPPLSYWIGWGWSRLFGLNEASMRLLSGILTGAAAVVVVTAAREGWGRLAGYWAGCVFVLNPNIVTMGVEIRAYPLLLLLGAIAFLCLLRISRENDDDIKLWVVLTSTCLSACYTHFFGLLLSGAVMTGATANYLMRRRSLGRPIGAVVVLAIGSLGLWPFVRGALVLSRSPESGPASQSVSEVVKSAGRLGFRLLGGHPSARVFPILALLILIGTASLIVISMVRMRRCSAELTLVVVLGSALAVACFVKSRSAAFDALGVTYSIWMLPAVCLLACAGVSNSAAQIPALRRMGAGLLALGNLGSTVILIAFGSWFAHSAGDRLVAAIEQHGGPDRKAILLDANSTWGSPYFPLRYRFGNALNQYLADQKAVSMRAIQRLPSLAPTTLAQLSNVDEVWLLTGISMDTDAIVADIRGQRPKTTAATWIHRTLTDSNWSQTSEELLPAMGAVLVTRYVLLHQ